MNRLLSIVILFATAACAWSPPSAEEMAAADFGPSPKNYEQSVKSMMGAVLIDPYSARYQFSMPQHDWYPADDGYLFGWSVLFGLNSKNRMGGYVGQQTYKAFFDRGMLLGILEPSLWGQWRTIAAPPASPLR